MEPFDFFENDDIFEGDEDSYDLHPVVSNLIKCTQITSEQISSVIKIPTEREIELLIFAQWITMNSAIVNNVDPSLMDNYYLNDDVRWMIERKLSPEIGPKISKIRIHRFNEYSNFNTVLAALFGGAYDGTETMKFTRTVFNNLLGDEAYDYLLSEGPMLPIRIQKIMILHGTILN